MVIFKSGLVATEGEPQLAQRGASVAGYTPIERLSSTYGVGLSCDATVSLC